jgi:hypothetical protein
MDLAAIVRTLRSDKTKEEKIKELQKISLLPPEFPKGWEVLVTKFSASQQLDKRAAELRLPPGDKGERGMTPEEERAITEKMTKEKAEKQKQDKAKDSSKKPTP